MWVTKESKEFLDITGGDVNKYLHAPKYMFKNVLSSFILNSQNLETIYMFINNKMDG